ncbi:phosphatase PAP2 family protein [Acidiferrobacter sp.]|uniref:phosphatase PAP2 family protein n=1 Tax=Acidiferrobacter sp. TaxID=1872107 RepID=UPI002620063E|nr:phosphatase PAP2 family protein [Acidiferrobacter sp.]
MQNSRCLVALALVLNLAMVPFAYAKPPTPGPTLGQGIARDFTQPQSALGALGDTTVVGIGLGLLDYAGLHKLDHPVSQDNHGVYAIAKTPTFPFELIMTTLGAAIWEGGRTRLGHTLWQSLDAAALAGVSTQILKFTFQRNRPSQSPNNPDLWFQGIHSQSFPSGDVSSITALVTPLILTYKRREPAVWALALVPAFDMVARVKAHGHWETDVAAGAVIGALSGYYAHERHSPFILSLLPNGFYMGLRSAF